MEKIILKPSYKELVHKNGEEGVHFDVLSYQGSNNREKVLGALFVVGQIKYTQEDLSYAINLISSLAKREYYSETSLQGQDPKKSFEHTLGKLNEVLEEFFKNKGMKLNIGLVAISGTDVYISRLGRLRVSLTRDGKYIDVLNNVDLFNKDSEDAKQFSNIISGKLHPQDKIFAYFPTRSLIAREKQLNDLFVKEDQGTFSEKVAQLASNASNFSCCGVHINMQEIKEIPVEARPIYAKTASAKPAAPVAEAITVEDAITKNEEETKKEQKVKVEEDADELTEEDDFDARQVSQRIIPSQLSVTRRANLMTFAAGQFNKVKNFGKLSVRAKSRAFLIIAVVVILPLVGAVVYRSFGSSSGVKNAINKASQDFKLAQSQINQNNAREARSLLQATLLNTTDISNNKQGGELRAQISQTLDAINHTSDRQPELYFDITSGNSSLAPSLITASDGSVSVVAASGSVALLTQSGISATSSVKLAPKFIYLSKSSLSLFDGQDGFSVYDFASKKNNNYTLKDPAPANDAIVYQDNLYLLSQNSIYKYADVTTGGVKQTTWGSDSTSGNLISLTADGNLYALSADGKLVKYFKGQKSGELDLQLSPASDSRIFTFKDSAFVYLTDKNAKAVYIFDKTSGELKTTYKLSNVGSVSDISVSSDGVIWILSGDGKVWVVR